MHLCCQYFTQFQISMSLDGFWMLGTPTTLSLSSSRLLILWFQLILSPCLSMSIRQHSLSYTTSPQLLQPSRMDFLPWRQPWLWLDFSHNRRLLLRLLCLFLLVTLSPIWPWLVFLSVAWLCSYTIWLVNMRKWKNLRTQGFINRMKKSSYQCKIRMS